MVLPTIRAPSQTSMVHTFGGKILSLGDGVAVIETFHQMEREDAVVLIQEESSIKHVKIFRPCALTVVSNNTQMRWMAIDFCAIRGLSHYRGGSFCRTYIQKRQLREIIPL